LPLLILLPFKLLAVRVANRQMDAYFQEHGIGWGLIRPGSTVAGFIFTALDEGTKQFCVRLLGPAGAREFAFSIPVPGLKVDHANKPFDTPADLGEAIECDETELRQRLAALPRSTKNRKGTVEGDPLNLVVIGEFDTVLNGFGARWDETEAITFTSCLR